MASLDRMEVDDNSSDGESSGEENPEEMSDKKAWLAWARALTWDAAVADDRDCFSVDALPDDDHRRNTAELIADLQTLRQLSETPVGQGCQNRPRPRAGEYIQHGIGVEVDVM